MILEERDWDTLLPRIGLAPGLVTIVVVIFVGIPRLEHNWLSCVQVAAFGALGSYMQLVFSAGLNSKSAVPLLDYKEIVLQLVWGMLFGVLGLALFVNSDKIDSWQPSAIALIMGFASNAATKNLTDTLRDAAEIKREL
jgi:hypothetical protein